MQTPVADAIRPAAPTYSAQPAGSSHSGDAALRDDHFEITRRDTDPAIYARISKRAEALVRAHQAHAYRKMLVESARVLGLYSDSLMDMRRQDVCDAAEALAMAEVNFLRALGGAFRWGFVVHDGHYCYVGDVYAERPVVCRRRDALEPCRYCDGCGRMRLPLEDPDAQTALCHACRGDGRTVRADARPDHGPDAVEMTADDLALAAF